MCKNKSYGVILDECSILDEVLYMHGLRLSSNRKRGFYELLREVDRILNTNFYHSLKEWDGYDNPVIRKKERKKNVYI